MTLRHSVFNLKTLRLPLIAGSACSVLLISGCGGESEAEASVKKAGRSFNVVAVGDANATPTKSEEYYRNAEQALAAHAGDSDEFAEAAAVGVAMAKRGQASLASRDAVQAESEALNRARIIRGMINEWLTLSAIAEAAGQFDPSDDVAELNSIIEIRQDDIANYKREMESINTEIANHESKIADLRAKSSDQRNQAGGIELQIPRVSAQEGAKLAEQVREFTLRADQYDLEATRIEGIVAQLRPGAQEVQLNVEKADAQIKLLGDAIEELRDRAAKSQSDAAEARTGANNALSRINDAVSEYQDFRDSNVESAHSKAISLIRAAISASRDARDAVKNVAAINKADAQQMLAEFQMRQANGEREEAMLYQALEEAGVPGSWTTPMNDANATADDLHTQAQQSYTDAASALRSVRAQGDASERLAATAERLDRLGGVEPEPEYNESGFEDDSMESDDEYEDDGIDVSEMTLEEIIENTPEDMRETVAAQLQALNDTLQATEDVDVLYEMLDQVDAQASAVADTLPEDIVTDELIEQLNMGFEWVKVQIFARIDELEAEG